MRFCTVRVLCARETSPGWKQARKEIIPQITNGNAWLIFPTMTTLSPESNYIATKSRPCGINTRVHGVFTYGIVAAYPCLYPVINALHFFFPPRKVFRHELAKSLAIPPLHTSLCVDWFKVRISAGVWDGRVVRVCVWNQTDIESLHIFCAVIFPFILSTRPHLHRLAHHKRYQRYPASCACQLRQLFNYPLLFFFQI